MPQRAETVQGYAGHAPAVAGRAGPQRGDCQAAPA
jgi:hypothetical protein